MDKILTSMMEASIFEGLTEEECCLLAKALQPYERFFLKGEAVCHEDEEVRFIGYILSGRVMGEKSNFDGQAHLVHVLNRRDILGIDAIFSSKKTSPITIVAAEDTTVLLFPYSETQLRRAPVALQIKLKDNIIRILANENIRNFYKLEVLSKRALRCRIKTFLCIMSNKVGSPTFHIGMDREQFAAYLCVNRSALSNELAKMRKEGLIDFDKDLFTVLNMG